MHRRPVRVRFQRPTLVERFAQNTLEQIVVVFAVAFDDLGGAILGTVGVRLAFDERLNQQSQGSKTARARGGPGRRHFSAGAVRRIHQWLTQRG